MDNKLYYFKLTKQKFRTLVFCGGGSKCITFCGVIKFMQEHKMLRHVKKIIATSAGSIIALLIALKYEYHEIDNEMNKWNSQHIFQYSLDNINVLSLPSMFINIIRNKGIDNKTNFRRALQQLFTKKNINCNITLKHFYYLTNIDLIITAVCYTDKKISIFSKDTTPNIKVIDAILASACIPILFTPTIINNKEYLDGGLINNFPLRLVSKKEKALAFMITTLPEQINNTFSNNQLYPFIDYLFNIFDILFINTWSDIDNCGKNIQLCNIHVPHINFINLNLTNEQKQRMKTNGYNALNKLLYDDGILEI